MFSALELSEAEEENETFILQQNNHHTLFNKNDITVKMFRKNTITRYLNKHLHSSLVALSIIEVLGPGEENETFTTTPEHTAKTNA